MIETVAAHIPTLSKHPLPEGACDCHTHIFGPLDQFPTGKSSYAIPIARPEVYEDYLSKSGFARGVIIQPAPYGQDTSALMHALDYFKNQLRGIAVADSSISDDQLFQLNNAGIRGLRFIEKNDPRTNKPYSGSVGVAELKKLSPRMEKLGWQAHIWTQGHNISKVFNEIRNIEVPFVFDHMGHFDVTEGVNSIEFKELLNVLKDDRVWTKLSVCRVSSKPPFYEDLRPYHDRIIEQIPDRLLWGSDWPFVAMGDRSPDVGSLIDLFYEWVGDADVINRIFVANPKRLFDF